MIGRPKVKWNKKLKSPSKRRLLRHVAELGQDAGEMVRDRVLGPNVDANGKRLPALARKGAYWTEIDGKDVRTKTSVSATAVIEGLGGGLGDDEAWITIEGKPVKVRLYAGGYGKMKSEFYGGQNRRDGKLTGSMWESLSTLVTTNRKGRVVAKVYFAGTDKNHKTTVKYKGQDAQRSLRQRVKAARLMFTERDDKGAPTGKQAFILFEWTQPEMNKLAKKVAPMMALELLHALK